MNPKFNEIKSFQVDNQLPIPEQNELVVFQRAMACLEEEYLQILNQTHPSQIAIFRLNEAEAIKKLKVAENERDMRLSSIEAIYEDEKKSIEKKYDNSKKSLFERTSSAISKCDVHLINELKNMYPERKKKLESLLLDISRSPPDEQIMQKVQHNIPKQLGMTVKDHEREHDSNAIKSEANSLNRDDETSFFIEQSLSKAVNAKSRKSRFSIDLPTKEKAEEIDVSDDEE